MAFIQDNKIPPVKKFNFSLRDFSGGMNNRSDQIEDNEGSVVLNLMFADDTILETRYGQKYYDDVEVNGAVIYIDEYKPYNDTDQFIRATESTIYFDEVGYPIQGKPSGVNHLGKYYFSDGKELLVYGKFEQEGSTYVEVIGDPVDDYSVFKIVTPEEDFTPMDKEHTEGKKIINYDNMEVSYQPCELELEDTMKGFNVVPESVKYVVSHTGRVFASGNEKDDDNVFISDTQNPLYFPVGLPLQVPPTSDKITGLHVFDNSVIIGRAWDMYSIVGSTNNPELGVRPFEIKRLNTHTGFASNSAINIAHNYLIFLGTDGNVYGMRDAETYERDLATVILSRTINLERDPINVPKESYKDASSFFHKDEWYLSVDDVTMVYSYRHMAWVMYKGLNATCFYGKEDGDWMWGRPEGRIATFDKENFFDFGEPYQTLWYSKLFNMDDASNFKQFREFFLVAHTFDLQYSDIYVTFEIDYSDIKDRAVISNQIARWGFAKWGDRFVTRRINESLPFIIGRRGRNIRFKITNNYDLDGEVNDYSELENYPAKREGLLVKLQPDGYYLYREREWVLLEEDEMNQRMKIYEINGEYEMRGKR